MEKLLIQITVLVNFLLVISTVINVIHKLKIIQGPNAHIAIAILSILVLFGYSGILNTIFLRRKFYLGRIIYIGLAVSCQVVILTLSFLSYYNIMTYFDAIAIIHAIMGLIVMINFTCAVIVVIEQQREIDNDPHNSRNAKLRKKMQALEALMRRHTYIELELHPDPS